MNARRVSAAAGVVFAAMKTRQTATGIAAALESAGLLQSPESAAELVQLHNDVTGACLARHEEEQENVQLRARVDELEAQAAKAAGFCAQRAEYVTALLNCHPDNGHDYDRWQGHAAARRQLSELLGLPVGWPAELEPRPAPVPMEDPNGSPTPSAGALAEQRHLIDPLDHVLEHLADEYPQGSPRRLQFDPARQAARAAEHLAAGDDDAPADDRRAESVATLRGLLARQSGGAQ